MVDYAGTRTIHVSRSLVKALWAEAAGSALIQDFDHRTMHALSGYACYGVDRRSAAWKRRNLTRDVAR